MEEEVEEGAAPLPAQQKRIIRRRKRTKAGRFVDEITVEELTQVMNLPAQQAAITTGVSFTVFKKLCRKFGLERWPYRRLKAMGLVSTTPPPEPMLAPHEPPPPLPLPPPAEGGLLSVPELPSNTHLPAPSELQQPDHFSGDEVSPLLRGGAPVGNACLGICGGLSCLAEAAAAQAAGGERGGCGGERCQAVAAAASPAPSPTPMAVDRHPLAAWGPAPAAAPVAQQKRHSVSRLLAEAMAVARDEGALRRVLRTLLGEVERRLAAHPADPLQEAALIRLRAATQKRLRDGPAVKPGTAPPAAQQPLQGMQRCRGDELGGAALPPPSPASRHTATPGISVSSGFARYAHAGGVGSQSPHAALASPFAAPEVQRCPLPIRPRLVPLLPGLLLMAAAEPPPPRPLPLNFIMARLEALQAQSAAAGAAAQ